MSLIFSSKATEERTNITVIVSVLTMMFALVAVLLLIAVAPLPYGYYTLVRLVVTACAAFTAYTALTAGDKSFWPWAAILVAFIFNPVIPVRLTKEIWMCLDVAGAIFFGTLSYKTSRPSKPSS